jgi:hypothetical protein
LQQIGEAEEAGFEGERSGTRRQEIDWGRLKGVVHCAATQSIRTILFHRRFPIDRRHNSKIGREALAGWASRKLMWR